MSHEFSIELTRYRNLLTGYILIYALKELNILTFRYISYLVFPYILKNIFL